ncbi:hypothetical protein COCC4DRAFT_31949 [Bipolaris maydis ATCC 48331]|uniref:Copper transport protein n=3 Tax=Cochliobolus heterostrophus TaxID=5016 RepID=M2TQU8_COCH5|nr:uncharacterized protein COCC4DRAFT_31949 [Bipolaris maydis ATCC 48331]EMD88894.1 hypothetical protein COCHEDRAFT_1023078 [Bipolaris maydis C5]ENI05390.1 hypothetical protein COCC4DRAFT_31949 [Bipolaris maydis ATCC 48331]
MSTDSNATMSGMNMSTMSMTFFTSTTTSLFSASWTPTTPGQYTGTCIFLIALAALFRALIAVRFNLFTLLAQAKGQPDIEHKARLEERRWRADEAVWIASLDVVLAGVSYLL